MLHLIKYTLLAICIEYSSPRAVVDVVCIIRCIIRYIRYIYIYISCYYNFKVKKIQVQYFKVDLGISNKNKRSHIRYSPYGNN